jgi:peptidoglycan/xylan/chitin deacetylase (PgdA/CDA1 family)
MAQPLASLSLDLDNKWSYMKTHGDRGWENFPSYLDEVVPRFLGVLQELGLRITVFVVGQDAARDSNRDSLSAISAAGHGIGNHSFHHEPWLHLYSARQIDDEISAAEEVIDAATGIVPSGFRGPGYSVSPAVIACLARRGYRYDASTLPTLIGPLSRSYYFVTARLNPDERRQRDRLFGGWTDGLRPLRPYWWRFNDATRSDQRLLEIPVTTLPVCRVPIHFSYLLFLRQFSRLAAWSYWHAAMNACGWMSVEPSLLLHPLDFLGGDEEPDLGFFPAMRMAGAEKRDFVRELLADFARRFRVVSLDEYAAIVAKRGNLKSVPLAGNSGVEPGTRSAEQNSIAPCSTLHTPRSRETTAGVEVIQQ